MHFSRPSGASKGNILARQRTQIVQTRLYYSGSNIHYKWYDGLPQQLLIEGNSSIALPVDQDFVQVFREGGHLAFTIAEPEESLHAIFRPFVLAAHRRPDPP